MGLFDKFKKKEKVSDFSFITKDNVETYIKKGDLLSIYLISPNFGGSEGIDNQVIVTKEAAIEKDLVDKELECFLIDGKSVKNFNCNLEYKNDSIIPSKIVITAIIDGNEYNKNINIW